MTERINLLVRRDAEDELARKTFLTVGMLRIREKINIFNNMDGDNGKIKSQRKTDNFDALLGYFLSSSVSGK